MVVPAELVPGKEVPSLGLDHLLLRPKCQASDPPGDAPIPTVTGATGLTCRNYWTSQAPARGAEPDQLCTLVEGIHFSHFGLSLAFRQHGI